ncbi:MAG TPA: tRNA (N6-isopentenyl adenosine(37)-C2)-methylthiotransferase MiaB [Firmicutes bacterium]|nr:tRNA (N6-isopentenyl adenosine(37)-C2)-methylthiotransferase MiaB [Bacillota bacterium]
MQGHHRKYLLQTFGCQMNVHDSEIIAGILEKEGYVPARDPEEADLILFNTCCVRENPERKVYGRVGDLKRLKEKKPDLIIGICGCMVQQEGELEKIKEQLPHVDLVFGTHNIHRLPELLHQVEAGIKHAYEVWDEEREERDGLVEGLPVKREGDLKAWVTIMYGCDNFCSYCIVPYVRGRERSRPFEEIIAEVTELGREGYKEVTLLGQNVNAYGKGLPEKVDFADLLAALDRIPGIERIRYTTSHPRDFSSKLIKTIAASRKVCEHFHLPLQAGSDKILRKMNRGYTSRRYLDLVAEIREHVPGSSITTDLIVGFPGETEEDFQATLDMIRKVEFDSAFTFIYSPRRGTAAARMPDQVPEDEKRDRIYRLIEVQNEISLRKNEALKGRVVEVLVEGESETNPALLQGRTRTNKLVLFAGDRDALYGKLVDVRVTEPQTWVLKGELASGGEPV